jgi:hypothetical protein
MMMMMMIIINTVVVNVGALFQTANAPTFFKKDCLYTKILFVPHKTILLFNEQDQLVNIVRK